MVAILKPSPLQNSHPEKRVTLHGLTWLGYQQVLRALPQSRSLEIRMTTENHEFASELIGLFIRILVEEMDLKLKSMRSTTLNREDLDRGAEPDNAYYIQNQAIVAGRNVDLASDPPPDLIVDVDISHSDIDKNSLYAAMGVPEFWRFNGQEWRIYQLQGDAYTECDRSPTFPMVAKEDLYQFLAQAQQDEIKAAKSFRELVKLKVKS
jgi:Uma2 family endonuclease